MGQTKLWAVAGLSCVAMSAWAEGRISSVEIETRSSGLDVVVSGTDLTKPKELRILNGESYIVEFDAKLDVKGFRRRMPLPNVSVIEVGWYSANPPKVRVHLRLLPTESPRLVQQEGKWVIRLGSDPAPAQMPTVLPATRATEERTPFPSTVPPLKPAEVLGNAQGNLKPDEAGPKPILPPTRTPAQTPARTPVQTPSQNPAPAQNAAPAPNPVRTTTQAEKRVNLDFVGADVVQVLRALSQESGVNIVTAPDVSPSDKPARVTVSLRNVTVTDALNYVTVMAGLRYAKMNNTFFVTRAESFASTMRQFYRGDASRFESRVVNLLSGEAVQIRNAVLASLPQDGNAGFYDILDPNEGMAPAAQAPATPAAAPGAPTAPSEATAMFSGRRKTNYLVLIGDPKRLDDVTRQIAAMDLGISQSSSVGRSGDTGTAAVPILSGQTEQIKTMLEKLLEPNPRRADFTISSSVLKELTEGDTGTSVLLMIGPKSDLEVLKMYAQTLDENLCRTAGIAYASSLDELGRTYEVVDLKYLEPTVVAFDLKNRIRGLFVSTLPTPVTPGIAGEVKDEKTDQTREQVGPDGQAQAPERAKKDELTRSIGIEPMKLILRGTRQQLDEAKKLIGMMDVRPKQIAFELRVLELTKVQAEEIGLNWSLVTGGRLQNIRINQGLDGTADSPGRISGSYRYQANDIVSFLAALDSVNDGRRLIARPNALASDGRQFRLFVGDTIRYVETIQSSQNGVSIQTGSVDVGVTLDMLGRFGGDGSISMTMDQRFTLLNGFTPVPGGGQLPQTSERRTFTTVNMYSGQVVAFGGLIQERDRTSVSGIPILKDLPIIGALFSRREKSKERTEIVFILAAVEVTDENRSNVASPRNSMLGTPDPMKLYQQNQIRNGTP